MSICPYSHSTAQALLAYINGKALVSRHTQQSKIVPGAQPRCLPLGPARPDNRASTEPVLHAKIVSMDGRPGRLAGWSARGGWVGLGGLAWLGKGGGGKGDTGVPTPIPSSITQRHVARGRF
ncbi:hypothetical protein PILCRDRAFT_814990, partial [Piloderma croceum F 1598]